MFGCVVYYMLWVLVEVDSKVFGGSDFVKIWIEVIDVYLFYIEWCMFEGVQLYVIIWYIFGLFYVQLGGCNWCCILLEKGGCYGVSIDVIEEVKVAVFLCDEVV